MNFKKLLIAAILVPASFLAKADEGMWIPSLIGKNYAEMQKLGLKLTASDIYNINKSSVKDAIVSMGFCTGELISAEGLFLTNHHCGYGSIQFNSTVEHDYLTDGFWAKSKSEELQAPAVTASILQRIEDVTGKVKPALVGLNPTERNAKIKELETKLGEEITKGTTFNVQLKEMFYGNQFFIYVYQKFTDVRLVGAPPSAIGKFGGDTDNWMWPRHTGDFSLFRIYMSKDGKPAAYSKDNVPYKPKHFLPISLKGVHDNDYTMVLGFPGRTNRYASSFEMQNAVDNVNPALIDILGLRLQAMKTDMDKSDEVRIKLAAKYASMSNTWKYYLGQNMGLKRLKIVAQKKADEAEFTKWVNANNTRKDKYGRIFGTVDSAYKSMKSFFPIQYYYQSAALGAEAVGLASSMTPLYQALQKNPNDTTAVNPQLRIIKGSLANFYKDYSLATDKKVFAAMLGLANTRLTDTQKPSVIKDVLTRNAGIPAEQAFTKYTEELFSNSILIDQSKLTAFLANPSAVELEKDPIFAYTTKTTADMRAIINVSTTQNFQFAVARQKENYIAGLMEMRKGKNFYPDANSSLRLTYGKVADYQAADAIQYAYFTTTDGILQKEDPTNDEFNVPTKLMSLIKAQDFGRYADKDGKMHVTFIHTTDITGGNSGSPVINANGELIGAAFDGNWEAMTGDLVFDAKYKRTISVDIRYVLFIIDKFAGAQNIINELKLVGGRTPATTTKLAAKTTIKATSSAAIAKPAATKN